MKAIFALVSLLLSFALAQNDTSNCNNFACDAVEQSAATCHSQESTEQGFADCLCTDVLKVNLNRCVIGSVCAWDGTGNPDDQLCTLQFCVRKLPDDLQPQTICGFNVTSSGVPGLTSTSVSGSTVSTASITGTTSTGAVPTTETKTNIGTSTTAASGAVSTSTTTGGASTLDISTRVVLGTVFFVAIMM